MKERDSRKAFTLIELLIVVAIISILAAIAVPNFLEAQVRSKVSRVKADFRSIATALETYRLDHNNYPLNFYNSPLFWKPPEVSLMGTSVYWDNASGPMRRLASFAFVQLTSPVSYLTSVIHDDPFLEETTYNGISFDSYVYAAGHGDTPLFWRARENSLWALVSYGPDGQEDWRRDPRPRRLGNYHFLPYDPTNGTVSAGDLTLYGPAEGYEAY